MKLKAYLLIFPLFISCVLIAQNAPEQYDLIIRNGMVYEGNGQAGFKADIAIKADRIVAIKTEITEKAKKEIDAKGLIISPGFVDLHSHLEPLPLYPQAESHIRQGVTTALGGPDGSCPLPLGAYLDDLEKEGIGYNIGYLVGHNAIRNQVMKLENRRPTLPELVEMQYLVKKSMEAGAFGISTGLKYLPGAFSELAEVVAVSKVAGAMGGIYTSHLREEGLGLIEGVQEAIDIADQASIPVVLTHHKVVGQPMWGSSQKTTKMVDDARKKGLDVMIDQYPYTASYTSLSILIPTWSMAGGRYKAFAKRCEDPILRDSIKRGIIFNIINDRGGNDLKRVQFSKFDWKPALESKTLYDWAIQEGLAPTPENGAELIIQAQLHRGASCIFHAMDEADVKTIMQYPQTMIASDGRLTPFGKGHPHPRAFGTFPRVLGKFVREEKVLDLATALYKMTGLPAQRMGLTDRGLLKEGYFADITIFDANTIIDKADFQNPHQYPEGIHYVFINGQLVVEQGQYYDRRAGKVLRGKAFKE
jgi:dihydroorotase/N-acyl-D-amino-acid deacylase